MLIQTRPRTNVVDYDAVPPVCHVPVLFYLELNEYQLLTACDIERVEAAGSEHNPFGQPQFFSGKTAGQLVKYPIMLRCDAGAEADRLILHLPLADAAYLNEITEEADIQVHLTMQFRGSIEIPFIAEFRWIPHAKQLNFRTMRRTDVPRTIYVNVGLFVLLLLMVSVWNNTVNQGVHHASLLFSSSEINYALIFIATFFGLSIANLLTIGRRASTLRAFLTYPELYLGSSSAETFRSRITAVSLSVVILAVLSLGGVLWTWKLPVHLRANGLSFLDASTNTEIQADRIYARGFIDNSILIVGNELHTDERAERYIGTLRRRSRGPFSWLTPNPLVVTYRPFSLRYPRYKVTDACREKQTPNVIGDEAIVRIDAGNDFSHPCIAPFTREVRAVLGQVAPATAANAWIEKDTISIGKRHLSAALAGNLLDRYDVDRLAKLEIEDIFEQQDALLHEIVERAEALGTLTVPRKTFIAIYSDHMGGYDRNDKARVCALTKLRALFALYTRYGDEGFKEEDLAMIVQHFETNVARATLVNEAVQRIYWRLLLDIERNYPTISPRVREAIEVRLKATGTEYYVSYLEDCLRAGILTQGNSPDAAIEARKDFLKKQKEKIQRKPGYLGARLEPLRRYYESNEELADFVDSLQRKSTPLGT